MSDVADGAGGDAAVAALAIAEIEHFREGQLRIVLLLGAALSLVAPLELVGGAPAPVVGVVVAAALGWAANAAALRAHTRVFWELGKRPWYVLAPAALWGVALAVEGIGTHTMLFFAAAMLPALPIAAGRPVYGFAAIALMVASSVTAGFVGHLASLGLLYKPLSAAYLYQSAIGVLFTAMFAAVAERQLRMVGPAVIRGLLASGAPLLADPEAERTDDPDAQPAIGPRPSQRRLRRPSPDIAELARHDLGLTPRQMEMMLLSLAGYEEDEIPTRLAHLGGRGGILTDKTVRATLDAARARIAEAHRAGYVTLPQAAGLAQDALDRRTDPEGHALTDDLTLPRVAGGRRPAPRGSGRRRTRASRRSRP